MASRSVTVTALGIAQILGWGTSFYFPAVLAPPDALSMLMLAIPMCLLYELGVVAVRLFVRRAQTGAQASPKA